MCSYYLRGTTICVRLVFEGDYYSRAAFYFFGKSVDINNG